MLREEVRSELRVYMSRTGLSAAEIAERAGYARQTLTSSFPGHALAAVKALATRRPRGCATS